MKSLKITTSILLLALFTSNISFAQSFSYVDTEYILDKIPEYKSAQKQLDELAENWKAEIRVKVQEVDNLYNAYQAEQVLLPDEIRKKRENEILKKEDELNKLKEAKFGKEGDLFKKRKELIKPIQDKVFDAIQKLAQNEGIDFVFDKSGAVTMLFVNAKYDRSDEVLEILGIENIEK
ncbi:MAG: OmpH family outer membrane protein [Bacteroidetes bacterium]|jgi:outer membrane protein|nr:OmpH family outer membrane protein [Bacteroidota bacterium]MBT5527876.1 OmpH family outer membrane protein [Cytophagia bacterium]MBT3424893.1 OmpH family outer membrane protein [Bacteroidota bacterium]MBT3801973.1 OmpH family outer membrane protein [Bacteroidota bacterium]MBT3933931.1 OmpH family outer membrane protein [Bacteroidota bacterium]